MKSSQDKIADCLVELLKSLPYCKITVQMICQQTPVSRNTFYYYFENKDKLVEWICRNDFMKYCLPYFNIRENNIGAKSFFVCIKKNRLFYESIYAYDSGMLLHRCLANSYRCASEKENLAQFSHPVQNKQPRVNKEVYHSYCDNGIAAVVVLWIREGMKDSIEAYARDIAIMLTNSLEDVRDKYLQEI